jgi:hypothetical protein
MSSFAVVQKPKAFRLGHGSAASVGGGGRGKKGKGKTSNFKLEKERVFSSAGAPPNFRTRGPDNKTFTVRQMRNYGTFVSSAAGPVAQGIYFEMGAFSDFGNWADVFDEVRIPMIEFWVIPRMSVSVINTQNPGRLLSVVDYTDNTALGSETLGLEYANCLVSSGVDGHYRCFTPGVAIDADISGSQIVMAPWLELALATNVQHNAIKILISTTDVAYTFDLYARATFEFRQVK